MKQQPLEASKWMHIRALLNAQEMEELLEDVNPPLLFPMGSLLDAPGQPLERSLFLDSYRSCISSLEQGTPPARTSCQTALTCLWTTTEEALFFPSPQEGKYLLRLCKPAVQLQPHYFSFSPESDQFYSMIFGPQAIFWGLQFSYPQIMQDPESGGILKVLSETGLPNNTLFRKLQSWFRKNTQPAPFLIDGKKRNAPFRIGKKSFPLAKKHPQLNTLTIA